MIYRREQLEDQNEDQNYSESFIMYSENVLKLICYLERKKGEEEGKYIDCFSKHLTYQHPEYI